MINPDRSNPHKQPCIECRLLTGIVDVCTHEPQEVEKVPQIAAQELTDKGLLAKARADLKSKLPEGSAFPESKWRTARKRFLSYPAHSRWNAYAELERTIRELVADAADPVAAAQAKAVEKATEAAVKREKRGLGLMPSQTKLVREKAAQEAPEKRQDWEAGRALYAYTMTLISSMYREQQEKPELAAVVAKLASDTKGAELFSEARYPEDTVKSAYEKWKESEYLRVVATGAKGGSNSSNRIVSLDVYAKFKTENPGLTQAQELEELKRLGYEVKFRTIGNYRAKLKKLADTL